MDDHIALIRFTEVLDEIAMRHLRAPTSFARVRVVHLRL